MRTTAARGKGPALTLPWLQSVDLVKEEELEASMGPGMGVSTSGRHVWNHVDGVSGPRARCYMSSQMMLAAKFPLI